MEDLAGLSHAPASDVPGLDAARELVRSASRILVLTGSGVSAESGVPTFRGEDGLWKRYRPEELATPEAFRRDPRLVWEWYGWRREKVAACAPNPAHRAIAGLLRRRRDARLVTQNVDDLHERAAEDAGGGTDSDLDPPLKLHGSLFRVRCTRCGERADHRDPIDTTDRETLPRCACDGLLRPDVVWFGEALDPSVLDDAFGAAARSRLCLVAGTSALVHPAAALPLVTREAGGDVVEVNPEATPLSQSASVTLRGAAGVILPRLLAEEAREGAR